MNYVKFMSYIAIIGIIIFMISIYQARETLTILHMTMILGMGVAMRATGYISAYHYEKKRMKEKLLGMIDNTTDIMILKNQVKEEM